MNGLDGLYEPGMYVRNPNAPEWGVGQVQSNVGGKITVMFPDEGKVVIDANRVKLEPVFRDLG